jgi:hypothetical protein
MSEPASEEAYGDKISRGKISRPFSVTLLAVGVLMLTVINLARLIRAAELRVFLAELLPISPLYFILTGLLWTLVGVVLLWGLWRRRPWTPRLTLLTFLAYSFYFWFDRLFLAASARMVNWPFALAINLLLLAWLLWLFSRPRNREFFGAAYRG